jgi:hypothetical protein
VGLENSRVLVLIGKKIDIVANLTFTCIKTVTNVGRRLYVDTLWMNK